MPQNQELPPPQIRLIHHAEGVHMKNDGLMVGRADEAGLTRRGHTDAFKKGVELRLRGVLDPDHLYVATSPTRRTITTMARVASGLGPSFNRAFFEEHIEVTADIHEQDHGDSVGKPYAETIFSDEAQARIQALGNDFAQPGGESSNAVAQRGLHFLDRWGQILEPGEQLVGFTHSGLITYTAGHLEDWDYDTRVERRRQVDTLSETRFIYQDGAWHLEEFARPMQKKVIDTDL